MVQVQLHKVVKQHILGVEILASLVMFHSSLRSVK